MTVVFAAVAGLVFGLGLLISGMASPQKVLGFALVRKRSTSVLGEPMQMPTRKDIDAPLVVGASLFGIGWGLAGYCPGPALVGVTAGIPSALIFTVAMLAGMIAFGWWQASKSKSA